jgi:hypothetical protein
MGKVVAVLACLAMLGVSSFMAYGFAVGGIEMGGGGGALVIAAGTVVSLACLACVVAVAATLWRGL